MFLLTVITLACCTSLALSGNCYFCQNFEFEDEFYDPNCSNDQYSGHTITCEEEAHCFTNVYEDGRLHRGCEIRHNEVQCVHHNYPHQTQCFCEGDLCNVDLCNACIDDPNTKPTTIQTAETSGVTSDRTTSSSPTKPTVTTASMGTHEGTTPTVPTRPSGSTTDTPQTISTGLTTPSTSQIPTETPKFTSPTPEVTSNSPTPEITTPTEEFTSPTPEVTSNSPEVTTPTPEVSSNTPEITTPTEEVSTNSPEVTTSTSAISTLTPDISTQTPEITTSAEITSTSNSPTITVVETTTTPIKIVNITCYDCQNSHPEWEAFDETCPEPGYNGNTYACENCGSCFTEVHDDGSVIRGESGDFTEECAYGEDFVACYCIKDLCNTQLCEQC